jgi:CheY-like chemotaxis protein
MRTRTGNIIDILLVEDSPTDAMLAREAFSEAKVANCLHHVSDGIEAIEFLRRQGKYAHAPRPDLILLDLNMPRKDGREVLAEIKVDPDLMMIPVLVMTSSQAESDVVKSYKLHCNGYVVKPLDFQQFTEVVHSIDGFWFAVVTLPPAQNEEV